MTTETRVLGGRYELGERLGDGGMATVYAGTDRVLGRQVAVKILDRAHAQDAGFVERFRREAQAAARLNHQNVVAVYDIGSDDDVHYIVMEHVEGETLADLLGREGPLSPARVASIGAEICDGLAVAHECGIVHRDVKPGNVLLTAAGGVKVADFGIARAASGDALTMTGTVMGTASYLSPEQATGAPVDARSDLYGLGCVLYEMLTGRPPFTAQSPVAVASQHVEQAPEPPSAHADGIPGDLEATVLRALEKVPDARFGDAASMGLSLREATGGEQTQPLATAAAPAGERTAVMPVVIPDAPARAHRAHGAGRPWWPFVAGAVVLALLGLAFAMNAGDAPAPKVPPAEATAPSSEQSPAPPAIPDVRTAHDALAASVTSIASAGGMSEAAAAELLDDASQVLGAYGAADQQTALEEVIEGAATVQQLSVAGELNAQWEPELAERFAVLRAAIEAHPPAPVEEEKDEEGGGKGKGKGKGHTED